MKAVADTLRLWSPRAIRPNAWGVGKDVEQEKTQITSLKKWGSQKALKRNSSYTCTCVPHLLRACHRRLQQSIHQDYPAASVLTDFEVGTRGVEQIV